MTLYRAITQIRHDPSSVLSTPCVLALGAFLFGYKTADAGVGGLLSELDREFVGPESADACTRAFLSSSTSEEGLSKVLAVLERLLVHAQECRPSPGPGARTDVVSFVREPIEHQRPAMVLAEATPDWLYNYSQGYEFGLGVVNAPLAATQRSQFHQFEAWLQERYQHASARWYAIIRVYEGACESGVARFVELWDEFLSDPES